MISKSFCAQEQALSAFEIDSNHFTTLRIINTTLFLVLYFGFNKKMDESHIPR